MDLAWALGWWILAAQGAADLPAPDTSATDFPVFVWRVQHTGQALPESLVKAFGGVNVEGPDGAQWARSKGLDFYVGHAPGRNALHVDNDSPWYTRVWQAYWGKRDPVVLVREPCLSAQATLEDLFKRLERTLQARDGHHSWGISLGDEVGLTPYGGPLDLCESPTCKAAFRDFLGASSDWNFLLPEHSEALPYPDTDSTRLAWIEGDAQHVGAWLARRAFHHGLVTDTLKRLARRSRKLSPATPVGLFGQSGRSAFADVGVEEVFDELDFLEVYRLLDSRELLYTRRRTGQRSYMTIFNDPQAPHGPAWLAWEHWLRGGDGLVLWSDRDLLESSSYRERLENTVASIRSLRSQWPAWAPRPSRVAMVHSPDSLALNWLRDALNDGPTWMRRFAKYQRENGTREVSLRACLRLAEDCGLLPGAVPLLEVSARTPKRFDVLIANQLILLEERGIERLREHLGAGGRLLVIGEFGFYNRRGERHGEDLLGSLKEEYPQHVIRLPFDAQRYLDERAGPSNSYVDPLRERFLAHFPSTLQPAWSVKGADPQAPLVPWLRASQYDPDEASWLCAALPNCPSKAERALLRDVQVKLDVPAGSRVQWLHPPGAMAAGEDSFLLPAGEPLVFRLLLAEDPADSDR